jgi:hypothetical protein
MEATSSISTSIGQLVAIKIVDGKPEGFSATTALGGITTAVLTEKLNDDVSESSSRPGVAKTDDDKTVG